MAATYTTKAGDQWDAIARAVYGDELHADWLMENNRKHLDTFQFDAGITLQTPELPADQTGSLPPWRAAE